MHSAYLILISILLLTTVIVDRFYAKVSNRYATKLFLAILFNFSIFFFLVYVGIHLNIWYYNNQGILGVYYLSIPFEEYLYMIFAPYSSIVLWESFHKAIGTKDKRRKKWILRFCFIFCFFCHCLSFLYGLQKKRY